MNKIFKAIIFHFFILFTYFSICIADSTIIPCLICLVFVWPISKMLMMASSKDIEWVFGVTYLQKKFNNGVINDMTNE